jgi:hypothetical protein
MALTVETGAIVANANSYVSLGDARAYAAARGVTLSAVDATLEQLLVKAMDFLATLEPRFQGSRVSATQPLPWPRKDVTLHGFDFAQDDIPQPLIDAQCQLAMDVTALGDLMPNGGTGREVIRDKVDVIEQQFAETGDTAPQPVLVKAMALLQPLLTGGGGFSLTVARA